MFPFSNSDTNLESFKTPSFLLQDQIQNPISKQDDSHFFPSPFLNEQELPLNQIFQTDEKIPDPTRQKTDDHQPRRRKNPATAPRKRTGKKDRHSKICTAQGIRDRRMRLSLQVARKFFDLQDMLGYDKASKTIEWLFNQSNKAIKELVQDMSDAKSESLLSECEVVSGIEESSNKEGLVLSDKKADSREKARMMGKQEMEDQMQLIKSSPKSMNLEKLGFCSNKLFDGDDQEMVMGYGVDDCSPLEYQPSDSGTIEKLLGSSSSSDFMGSFGSWDDLLSNERLSYGVTNFQALMSGNPSSIYLATTSDFPSFHQ